MQYVQFKTDKFLNNPHMQTMWGAFFRPLPSVQSTQITIPLRDGLTLAAHQVTPLDQSTKAICILWHGLTGNSQTHYILGCQKKLQAAGIASIGANHRGSLGVDCPAFHGELLYHAGVIDDLQDTLNYAHSQFPNIPVFCMGVSLSGNMLVRALGLNALPSLAGACAVSVPFQLSETADAVDKGIGKLYQSYLLKRMKRLVQAKNTRNSTLPYNDKISIKKLNNIRSFWGFDNQVVAPMHGFRNVHDYYNSCSSGNYINDVSQPLLIMQSADDPLVPISSWPSFSSLPACVEFEAYDKGGHVGFVGPGLEYEVEDRLTRWINSQLDLGVGLTS